jgi:predicted RNase H-like HicB family nuclease
MVRRILGYHAVFISERLSGLTNDDYVISICIPDFPECVSCANSEDEVIEHAKESLLLALDGKLVSSLPHPRLPSEIVEIFPITLPVYVDKQNIVHCDGKLTINYRNYNELNFCVVVLHELEHNVIFFPDIPECFDNITGLHHQINNKKLFITEVRQLVGKTIDKKYLFNKIHTRKSE